MKKVLSIYMLSLSMGIVAAHNTRGVSIGGNDLRVVGGHKQKKKKSIAVVRYDKSYLLRHGMTKEAVEKAVQAQNLMHNGNGNDSAAIAQKIHNDVKRFIEERGGKDVNEWAMHYACFAVCNFNKGLAEDPIDRDRVDEALKELRELRSDKKGIRPKTIENQPMRAVTIEVLKAITYGVCEKIKKENAQGNVECLR